MRVAVYGGSFDPPHVAHVLAVAYALAVGGFERVVVVPVFAHAFAKPLAPYLDRVRMCELAVAKLSSVDVSTVEARLPSPSFTLQTLEQLAREQPDWELRLIVGADVLAETHKWHRFERVVELAPLFVLGRQGHPHPAAPLGVLPEVSSSQVRALFARSSSPAVERALTALVPRLVLEHARARGLYRCES